MKNSLWPYWLLFAAVFVYSLWAASVGFWHSILDEHSFRQAQTAITAHFLAAGGPFFRYETPVLGAPWSIPFELPVYQWIVVKFSWLSSLPIEQSGRVVGRAFFYLMLLPLHSILLSLGMSARGRIATLTIFLLSPVYLFWSRTFMIESTATFFGLAYLALALRTFGQRKNVFLLWALALFGALAGSVKVTTAFCFFVLAGLAFLYYARPALQNRTLWRRKATEFFFAFVLPGIAALAWIKFTDAQKMLNPLAEFIRSDSLRVWNFGTLAQRLSGDFWYMIFRKVIHDSIGHRSTWILSMVLLPLLPAKHLKLALACGLAFLLAPLAFTNLHIVHNYYWMANGIFLVGYLGFVIEGLWQSTRHRWAPYAGIFLFLFAIAHEYRHFQQLLPWQNTNNYLFADLAAPLAEIVPEKDAIVILGSDWYPAVPYAAKRRALMIRKNDVPVGSPRFLEALALVKRDGREVKAIVDCQGGDVLKTVEKEMQAALPYDPKHVYLGSCRIYRTL